MADWDACVHPDVTPVVARPDAEVWVGVDASTKRDSTAIVAVCWDRTNEKVRLVYHRIFQPSRDEPLDFESTIESTVLDIAKRFKIRKVFFDPYQMQYTSQRLLRADIPIEEYPQTSANLTSMGQNLYELITGRNLLLYTDDAMRLAASRTIAVETPRGWRIAKEKQSHKIDVIVALAMACQAATTRNEPGGIRWHCGDPAINKYLAQTAHIKTWSDLLNWGRDNPA